MTSERPTLHVTNWSSRKLQHGRRYTIMAAPRHRYGECGQGTVAQLVPRLADLRAVQVGQLPLAEYRARYLARATPWVPWLRPGVHPLLVDGDTVCCACSRSKAQAGACHRVWAADLLLLAGWRVVLDGQRLGWDLPPLLDPQLPREPSPPPETGSPDGPSLLPPPPASPAWTPSPEWEAIGPATGGELQDAQLPLFESDASLYHRARSLGWEPRPEHCPPASILLSGDWQGHARAFLRTSLRLPALGRRLSP